MRGAFLRPEREAKLAFGMPPLLARVAARTGTSTSEGSPSSPVTEAAPVAAVPGAEEESALWAASTSLRNTARASAACASSSAQMREIVSETV
jgi:hypothetical protein